MVMPAKSTLFLSPVSVTYPTLTTAFGLSMSLLVQLIVPLVAVGALASAATTPLAQVMVNPGRSLPVQVTLVMLTEGN